MYGILYATGATNGAAFEGGGQGRFAGPPLENLEAYIRNSPVFQAEKVKTPLLMLSNDMDTLVNFTQGMEYFNTLRRMRKPVVLLEYPGEAHGLAKAPNQRDYAMRVMAFFDHFLKGAPAPEWWSKGISLIRLEEQFKDVGPYQ
jgi:dipeptidyl aminopeptidase/acylaminoacyl peptidase